MSQHTINSSGHDRGEPLKILNSSGFPVVREIRRGSLLGYQGGEVGTDDLLDHQGDTIVTPLAGSRDQKFAIPIAGVTMAWG